MLRCPCKVKNTRECMLLAERTMKLFSNKLKIYKVRYSYNGAQRGGTFHFKQC